MKHRFLGLALTLAAQLGFGQEQAVGQKHSSFAIEGDQFLMNGQPFVIRSGELHYPRVPRADWRDRLAKMRAMGLNTVSTYVFWNLHEPSPGTFDFAGSLDLVEFIKIAQEEGLWVILRPGPYVCAEWEFGGFPSWLLKQHDLKVRSNDSRFVSAAANYLQKVAQQVKPLLLENGGPILMVQVENEYGSFGSDRDYMRSINLAYSIAGFTGVHYTADSVWGRVNVQRELSYGNLPELHATINFGQSVEPSGAFRELTRFRPGIPQMAGEYWVGWFDHFGESHQTKDSLQATRGLEWMLSRGISFNIYMFHGGTSFGFMNGANWENGRYFPDTTSYDYDAPLDEAGRPTPKYFAFRNLLAEHLNPGEVLPEVSHDNRLRAIPEFTFTETAPLSQLLDNPVEADTVQSMEDLDQAYGYILYRHQPLQRLRGKLELRDLHDYALLSQGGQRLGTLDRRLQQQSMSVQLEAGKPLDILVENMGRINFSTALVGERKGITEGVYLNGKALRSWTMYSLPLKDLSRLRFSSEQLKGPGFYRASFELAEVGDTFLDVTRFGKGQVFVNGKNLGRYWNIGPQGNLYCPASWLKKGRNEVIVLDLFASQGSPLTMSGQLEPAYIQNSAALAP